MICPSSLLQPSLRAFVLPQPQYPIPQSPDILNAGKSIYSALNKNSDGAPTFLWGTEVQGSSSSPHLNANSQAEHPSH